MKALVLGCGEMGRHAIRDLLQHGVFHQVTVATRRPERAEAFLAEVATPTVRTEVRPVDLADGGALTALMKGASVVCNTAGPNYRYAVTVARAAIAAGVSMVDLSDDWAATLEILELDAAARNAGVTVVVGLGASPGVTNILARYGANRLDRVDEVRTSWVMRGSDLGGPALSYHLLYSLPHQAFVFEENEMRPVRAFVDGRETIEFPELGPVEVYHIGHPEPFTLSRFIPGVRYADDKAAFLPVEVADLIVELGKLARWPGPVHFDGRDVDPIDFAAHYLHQRCAAMTDVPQTGALRTEVRGELEGRRTRIILAAAGRIGIGTGIPAAIGAQLLAIGKIQQKGTLPPEACIDPDWFLTAVNMRNIGTVEERMIQE